MQHNHHPELHEQLRRQRERSVLYTRKIAQMSQENATYRQQTDKMRKLPAKARLVHIDVAIQQTVKTPAVPTTGPIQPVTAPPITTLLDKHIRMYLCDYNRLPGTIRLSVGNASLLMLQGYQGRYQNAYGRFNLIADGKLDNSRIICS